MAAYAKTLASYPNSVRLFALGAVFAALVAAALPAPIRAAGSFDGSWRVTIITQSGNCDPAYSYPVKVEGGRVSYSGEGDFDISGHVGDAGTVSVTIARGDQKASGNGRLSANSGSGQWSGKSSSTSCSGRWEATRAS